MINKRATSSFATVTFAVILVSFGSLVRTQTILAAGPKTVISSEPSNGETLGSAPFVSKDGRFSVILPPGFSVPTRKVETASTATGELITLVGFQSDLRTRNGMAHCVIGYTDFPLWMFSGMSSSLMVDTARQGTLNSLPGHRVISDELFDWSPLTGTRYPTTAAKRSISDSDPLLSSYAGQPGRSTLVSAVNAAGVHYARFDIFLDRPRMYSILLAYDTKASFNSLEVKGFFESFHLVEAAK